MSAIEQNRADLEAIAGGDGRPEPREPLTVITAKELCELPDPPGTDELLGPLLVRGYRTVLGGYTGEGKSTLLLQLIKAVTEEGDFEEWTGAGGRALILDAEQGLRTSKRRLREADLEESEQIDYLRVPDGLALDRDENEAAELEAIIEAGGYAVVAPDPLYKLHRGDSNAEREAVDLMRQFDRWRENYRFALLLTTHPRKRPPQGVKFSMDEFFGSGAYVRGAEIVLGIQRVRPGYGRLHFFKDRDGDLPTGEAWGLLFEQEQGYRRDPEDGQPRERTADRVRELLAADPGMSSKELEQATGRKERTVREALTELGAVASGRHPQRWHLPAGKQEEMVP